MPVGIVTTIRDVSKIRGSVTISMKNILDNPLCLRYSEGAYSQTLQATPCVSAHGIPVRDILFIPLSNCGFLSIFISRFSINPVRKRRLTLGNTNQTAKKISKEVIEGFRAISVGDVGHILEASGFMDTSIRTVYSDVKLVGPAFTAKMLPGDNSLNRKVIDMAAPGDVIVVDRCGDTFHGALGGAVALFCKVKGVAGAIIDGAITDSLEISDLKWPVFTRSLSGLVGRRLDKGGAINVPVQCGGVVVHPGDLIVADDDGIAVIDPEESESLLQRLRDMFRNTPPIRKWIADGKRIEDHPNANLLKKK